MTAKREPAALIQAISFLAMGCALVGCCHPARGLAAPVARPSIDFALKGPRAELASGVAPPADRQDSRVIDAMHGFHHGLPR